MTANDMMTAAVVDEGVALLDSVASARMCGMSRAAWYKHLSAGKIPRPVKIGSLARWRKDELAAWIAAGCPARTKWDAMREKIIPVKS